jgi:hypothetical protein
MTKIFALPHLHTGAVEPDEWLVEIHGEQLPVPNLLKGWDYSTPLRFESTLRVDRTRILSDCGLGEDASVSAIAAWWASSTNIRQLGCSRPLTHGEHVTLAVAVPAGLAGGQLTLQRMLILERPGRTRTTLAATTPGSILWREPRERQTKVVLEGDAARFPTEMIDFTSSRVADPDSLWWLDHDLSDLDSTPLATLRLYLNESHPMVKKMVAGGADEVSAAVSQVLEWDITRTMCHAALDTSEFIRQWGSFRPGSLGEALELLLRRLWPGDDATSLSALRAQDPGVFEARMQGRLRLLAEKR